MLIFVFARLKLQLQIRQKMAVETRLCPHRAYKNIYANPLNDKQLIKMIYVNVSMAFNATHNTIE